MIWAMISDDDSRAIASGDGLGVAVFVYALRRRLPQRGLGDAGQ